MKNKIAQHIQRQYGLKPTADDQQLRKLNMSKKRLTRIMKNTNGKNSPLTAEELIRLMIWLRLDVPSSIKNFLDYDSVAADFNKPDHQLAVFN